MSHAQDLPLWAAIIVALLLLLGSGLALVGSYGFWKLRSFYDRVHAPTLGTSWGTGAIVMASMIFFSVLQLRPVLHEFLVGVFVTVTMPITLMLLARAAIYRDRAENNPEVPPMDPPRIKLDVGADPDAPESRS
ncbi:monovalent cation/H(+) antiporter subunit G [Aquamicrobium zhengzhouense]|uniref:Cation:proton antiporter n=1 Tax=Aquamicrobium zhengzhouense TaxID=2781738 RepID=A0ABS0S898_9HYPH|nr:monovalent cation/H(+) antiporter subunit G [Aquamicrobium zhengzhouense]MBI1619514.1 cation:proton antiporter [Aquamicrobium zhengzhouense]